MTTHQRETPPPPMTGFWGSYALGVLADVRVGADIIAYLERIEATLRPYGGVFLVHGGHWEQVEGVPLGDPVLIAFPDPDGAERWYRSEPYRRLIPLRADNSDSRVFLIRGVDASHRSADVIRALTAGADQRKNL